MVLRDIRDVLEVPSRAQQRVSAEVSPTVAFSLPIYQRLITTWKELAAIITPLSHYIQLGILKLEEYFFRSRRSRVFMLAIGKS